MSHHEKIQRMNAQLNTPDQWHKRWQIEREANERLNTAALRLRSEVLHLRRAAVERATAHQRFAAEARLGDEPRRAQMYDDIVTISTAKARAFDEVIAAMDILAAT